MRKRKQLISFSFFMSLMIFWGSILAGNIGNNIAQAADTYPPKSQTISQTIQAAPVPANPGTYWYQLDNGSFKADYSGGSVTVANAGSCEYPYPADTATIPDDVNLSRYPAEDWGSYEGWSISADGVTGSHLIDVTWSLAPSYEGVGDPTITSSTTAILKTKTGGSNTPSDGPTQFSTRPDGCPKVTVMYLTPVRIIWEGTINQIKEIDVNPDSTIGVGVKKQLNASVRTKNWGQNDWSDWVSVASRTETRWYTSDASIVEISSTGEITGKAPGTARVRAIWDNGTYQISDIAEITVTSEPGLVVNLPEACTADTTPKQAEAVLTKPDGSTYTLTAHEKLTWSSSNESIATIGDDGKITVKGIEGTTEITAHFYKPEESLDETDTKTLQVKDCSSDSGGDPGGGDPGGGSGGSCSPVIGSPAKGTINSNGVMDPSTNGVVRADNRDSEKFNVLDGIPTSESLYVDVFGMNYLFQNKFANMTGEVTYTVPVKKTYILKWTIPGSPGDPPSPSVPMQDTVTVTKNMTVKRTYSYWQIDNLEVYKISKTTVNNYALPNGSVTINPSRYTPPSLTSTNSDAVTAHVQPSACQSQDLGSQTINGGSSRPSVPSEDGVFQSKAESAVQQNKVRNDYVVFNSSTIMNNGWVDKTAPTPGTIPSPTTIGRDVLYGKNYVISNSLVNKANTPSTGTIYYDLVPGNIKGGSAKNYPVNGLNTVTVHTPVVIYASISDDRAHNQKTIPASGRDATILDRPFTIYMPTNGQHRNILGYGNRDYAKYVRDKQVYFPFDVYSGDKSTFYPKGTWISIPVNQTATTFFLPVWVDEGFYDVLFRTIAVNAPSGFTTESQANLNLANHVATDVVPVDVIGRVYDFHITDISDFNWETYFRKAKGSSVPTGNSFWVGDKDIDGTNRPAALNSILPVRQGSNTIQGMQNIAVKSGYKFSFDLKTKGNMFNDQDGIRITPTFYFVKKDGTGRRLVDLYYHSDSSNFVKIGSTADVERNNVILNSRLRNVPGQDLVDTSSTLWEMFSGPRGWAVTKQNYMDKYIKDTQKATYVGGYNVQILTAPLRTFKGNMVGLPRGVNIYRANAAVQQWYGEYSIPADPYVVPQGTNLAQYGDRLDDKSSIFLKDGYVVVNFTIETIKNGDTANPFLQYIRRSGSPYYGSFDNQWRDMEGFQPSFITPYGVTFSSTDGDVMYYHADKSSYDDYNGSGTH